VPESPRDPAHRDRPDWKGSRPRARRLSFGLRLGLALAFSMLIAVVGIGVVSSRLIADGLIDQGARSQRADARSIEAAFSEAGSGERAIEEAAEVVGGLANRPDVLNVFLVNAHGTVVASHDPRLIGTREPNPHFGAALREGRSYAGREPESGEASEFEFVTPLRLGRERYALEIDQDGRAMDDQIATLRQSTLLVSGAGLLLGLALFYGLGGRSLLRRHGAVVRRATRDPLTDLGNHRLFQDELARAVSFAARRNEPLALALLDLDDFKLINDATATRRATRPSSTSRGYSRPAAARTAPSGSAATSSPC
jgi:hypothetical protein